MIDQKLSTLLCVNEVGSFSKAARILNLTQPAVSTHIKELEKELGIKLFQRTQNGIKVTNEGLIAIEYAKKIQSIYARFQVSINNLKNNLLTVNIGVTHTAESSFAIDALARYANEKAGLHINFITGSTKILYDKLSDYSLDLALLEGHNYDNRFSSLLLDTDSLLLAVSVKNPLSKKLSISIDELRKQKMIIRGPESGTRQLFEASLAAKGLSLYDFDINIQSDSIATIKDLVIKDIGVSVLARSSCLNIERNKKVVMIPIDGLSMIREVNFVYNHDWGHPELLSDLVKAYKKESAWMQKIN